MKKVPMTARGFARLQEELKHLKTVERPQVISAISSARELGDLSENAEYHAAREKQSFIEGRIGEIEGKIAHAQVIDTGKLSGSTVMFGATVTLMDDENDQKVTYQIVGVDEADITTQLISISSPLGRALIGKKKGEVVEVVTPRGERAYKIMTIDYK